jgi:malate dehydrogenase
MKISIIGAAGNVGSEASFNLAINRVADELVMIDSHSPDRLEQYVYDLKSTVTGLDVSVREGRDEDLTGSNIVLISAGTTNISNSNMGALPDNLPLIRNFASKVKRHCPEAIVIVASNPVCPLSYGLYLASDLDRTKVIGYSANDSIRFRMFLAQALGIRSSRIEAAVFGEHGDSQVPIFSSVRVDGRPFKVSEAVKEQVREQVARQLTTMDGLRSKTGRTCAWTTSIGLTDICRAVRNDSRELIPSAVVLDGEYGWHRMCMSVPTLIGKEGVLEIQEWKLEPDEKEALEYSATILRPAMQYVEEQLGVKK